MYALKTPKPSQPPVRVRRVARKTKPQSNSHPYQAIVFEATLKLTVNVVLSVAAITALAKLLPYYASQEGKLQELDAALQSTNSRVQNVQTRFQNFFDPYQARENMQELTDRIDPNRRRIIWKNPAVTDVPVKPPAPEPEEN